MILLIGPSAVGKTEVGKKLISFGYDKLVTYTTRKPRLNELDGRDYHFIRLEKFEELNSRNFFLETVNYANNFYGTAFEDLSDNKFAIVEPQGLSNYKKNKISFVSFFLQAKKDTRRKRMLLRGDLIADVEKRLNIDDTYFNNDIKDMCDYVIEVDDASIDDVASQINRLYKMY